MDIHKAMRTICENKCREFESCRFMCDEMIDLRDAIIAEIEDIASDVDDVLTDVISINVA